MPDSVGHFLHVFRVQNLAGFNRNLRIFPFHAFFFRLLQEREFFAELLFLAVRLRVVNFGTHKFLGQVLLRGVAARAVVVVFVAVPVAELLTHAGHGIAERARHGERARLLYDAVGGHAGNFHGVALGRERKVNREFVERDEAFRDTHEVVGFAGGSRKQ